MVSDDENSDQKFSGSCKEYIRQNTGSVIQQAVSGSRRLSDTCRRISADDREVTMGREKFSALDMLSKRSLPERKEKQAIIYKDPRELVPTQENFYTTKISANSRHR